MRRQSAGACARPPACRVPRRDEETRVPSSLQIALAGASAAGSLRRPRHTRSARPVAPRPTRIVRLPLAPRPRGQRRVTGSGHRGPAAPRAPPGNRPSRTRADRESAAGHPGYASSGPSVAGRRCKTDAFSRSPAPRSRLERAGCRGLLSCHAGRLSQCAAEPAPPQPKTTISSSLAPRFRSKRRNDAHD